LAVLATGVPNLDPLLGGGVREGDMLLLVGEAGAGKSTLALQIAFHTAAQGKAVCFVTTASEPASRLLEHARSYTFFDERAIGRQIFLISVYPLIHQGLQGVREALEQQVRERGAALLVLDGLTSIHDMEPDRREQRRFVYELASVASSMRCTFIVTSSRAEPSGAAGYAEFTMADGLVRLSQTLTGTRSARHLQVVKVRGSSPMTGRHTVRLDRRGLRVFPRFESLVYAEEIHGPRGRASSGIAELDAMLAGGIPAGSVTAVAGATGTGKTLLALQFLLDGAKKGERGVFLTFRETPRELADRARAFGLDLQAAVDEGILIIDHRSPVDLEPDEVVNDLVDTLGHFDCRRFVLDGLGELMESVGERGLRWKSLMHVLSSQLRGRSITAVIPVRTSPATGPELELERTNASALAQNLILLRYVEYQGELCRILSILKVRDSGFDPSIRRYTIAGGVGLRVLPREETSDRLLEGIADLPSEARVLPTARPGDEP